MKTVEEILETMKTDGMAAEAGSKLHADELVYLVSEYDNLFELVCTAFKFGFYKGVQTERYKRRKNRKNR